MPGRHGNICRVDRIIGTNLVHETTQPSLLLRVRDPGDQSAWREFESKYRELILRYCLRLGLQSHVLTLDAMLGLGILYGRTDRVKQAVELLQEAVRLHRETKPENFRELGITLVHLGIYESMAGHDDEAEAAYLEGYQVLSDSLGPEIGWTQGVVGILAGFYETKGDEQQAALWRSRFIEQK